MTLINATLQSVRLANSVGDIVKIYEPSDLLVRVDTTWESVEEIDGFPVLQATVGEVTGLPPVQDGVTYIVSVVVAKALKGIRSDVVSTMPHGAVLSPGGEIIAVKGFQRP